MSNKINCNITDILNTYQILKITHNFSAFNDKG